MKFHIDFSNQEIVILEECTLVELMQFAENNFNSIIAVKIKPNEVVIRAVVSSNEFVQLQDSPAGCPPGVLPIGNQPSTGDPLPELPKIWCDTSELETINSVTYNFKPKKD